MLRVRTCPSCERVNPEANRHCAGCGISLAHLAIDEIPDPKPVALPTPDWRTDPRRPVDTDTRLFRPGSPELFCAFFAAAGLLIVAAVFAVALLSGV